MKGPSLTQIALMALCALLIAAKVGTINHTAYVIVCALCLAATIADGFIA